MTQANAYSRREILHTAAGTALGLAAAGHALGETPDTSETAATARLGIGNGQRTGEPYELTGKRMVFTNWYYVRPGSFGYFDAAGNKISLRGAAELFAAEMREFDAPWGIRLKALPAQREQAPIPTGTLIQDRGLYRAWGDGYLESTDGASWNKTPTKGGPAGTVFIDPAAPPTERYKAVGTRDATVEEFAAYCEQRPNDFQRLAVDADPGRVHAIFGSVSPDGIHWKQLPVPISVEHSDTHIVAYYDERLHKCVMYTRNYPFGPRSQRVPYDGFRDQWSTGPRSIGRSETDDFRHFPVSEVILEPTPDMAPTDMLYTNCRTAIPGAPDHHLMFPAIWHRNTDTTSIGLLSSPNGKLWNYVPGSPVFETPPFGEWDGGCVFAMPNLVEFPDGRYVLPYTGFNIPHKYPRKIIEYAPGYMSWPKGRLIGLEAQEHGAFTTVAFVPPGRKLRINAQTHRVGRILVEVVAYQDCAPIAGDNNWTCEPTAGRTFTDCAPIVGDHHWTTVNWKGQDDLGHKEGAAVMLRFQMERAEIFGLEFG